MKMTSNYGDKRKQLNAGYITCVCFHHNFKALPGVLTNELALQDPIIEHNLYDSAPAFDNAAEAIEWAETHSDWVGIFLWGVDQLSLSGATRIPNYYQMVEQAKKDKVYYSDTIALLHAIEILRDNPGVPGEWLREAEGR